ncbi:MAG TPA: YbhB/YbcL family Raf kinase inhibitor-like protein [Rectinemataceae bacterium]|nr:YbhB/YbcL family Raf kinase inhibitor-like protein [Rectinemataceae bacterium]
MKALRVVSLLVLVAGIELWAQKGVAAMKLESSAFPEGGTIPKVHSFSADNLSPPLSWTGVPPAAKAIALICDDPDAPKPGGWVHWVVWDIPASHTSLALGLPQEAQLPDGSRQGLNDWRKVGWGGPQPPSGVHHYVFRIFALDRLLGSGRTYTRDELLKAMQGHILAQGELIGTFAAR